MFGKTLTGLMGKKMLGLKLALIGGTGALLLAASAPAQASNVRVGIALNLGGLIGPPAVAYTSPPQYPAPPATYCAPPTVIYQSAPTYYQYPAYHPEFHFWADHNDHHFAGGGGWNHRFGDRR